MRAALVTFTCVFLAIAYFAIVIADGFHEGEYGRRSRRQGRPHLPRRAARLTAEDAETIAWARSLRRTWARDAAAVRIAAIDVSPAGIPPTETPDPAPTDVPGPAAVRIAEQTCRAKPDRPTEPGVIAGPGTTDPQLDYADTGTGWAELRELAAMLAADWGDR